MTLTVAGNAVTHNQALAWLRSYPAATLRYYDGAPSEPDRVTLEDIGAMALINADLGGDDAAALLSTDALALFEAVPADADLRAADPEDEGGLYDAAVALYDAFRRHSGIGPAKASKLLHRKRPRLYPILDAQVQRLYDEHAHLAASASRRWQGETRLFWAAIRADLIANAAHWADIRRAFEPGKDDRLIGLSDLRLLDIVCWRLATSAGNRT